MDRYGSSWYIIPANIFADTDTNILAPTYWPLIPIFSFWPIYVDILVQPYTANKSTNVHLNSRKAKNQKPSECLNVGRHVQMRGDLCCSTLKMKNKKKWRRQSRIFCKTNLDYSSKSHTFAFTTGHSFAPKHKSRHESKIISASDSKWFSEVCYSLFDNDILILLCFFFPCYKSC